MKKEKDTFPVKLKSLPNDLFDVDPSGNFLPLSEGKENLLRDIADYNREVIQNIFLFNERVKKRHRELTKLTRLSEAAK